MKTQREHSDWSSPAPLEPAASSPTWPSPLNDREKKIHGYARAGIPVYLLIDREEGEAIVYSEPSGDDYTQNPKYKLGLAVPLPAPLGFELDTAEF